MSGPLRRLLAAIILLSITAGCSKHAGPDRTVRAALPDAPFAQAVATNDARLFELSAAQHADINSAGSDGRSALYLATEREDTKLIERLLELGASVDRADGDGITPLMLAAKSGEVEFLTKFVSRSQDPAAADAQCRTAAHYAIASGNAEAVALLLEATRQEPNELLAIACDSGDPQIIQTVLAHAPSSLEWTSHTRATLKAALASGDAKLTRLLLSKHPAPPTVDGGTTPLLASAIVGDERELFDALLAAGADPNTTVPTPAEKSLVTRIKSDDLRSYVRGDQGVTVLMLAAGLGKTEYVRALLDAGADRNRQTTRYKMLALYFAARTQKAKCVQMLLGRGPSVEQLRVEISLSKQRAFVIKNGVQILQTTISTGRKGFDTPSGEYVITDKNRNHRSTIYKVDMPFFMRLNCLDFGMHAGVVPNYPASHGCIRLPGDVAEKLFSEIPVGTVVMIN